MVDLNVAQGSINSRMVDLTVAQRGMKLRDGRFDCGREKYETQGR